MYDYFKFFECTISINLCNLKTVLFYKVILLKIRSLVGQEVGGGLLLCSTIMKFKLNCILSDSPVLWIRLDPEMTLLRSVVIEQPDFQWQFQLRHERDVTAQMEAILALERYPTPATRLALTDTIENEHCYYKVRCRAAHCLTKVSITQASCIEQRNTLL